MHVEIWSDIACPWCYIGKRRFEAALRAFEHAGEVTVTWRSFELDPEAPAERGGDHAGHIAAKYGLSVEQARQAHDQMTQAAAAEGLAFDFTRVRSGSTFDAHRIIHLAAGHGRQDAMKERLLRAYFTEGRLVSDPGTLAELAAEIDLPEGEVREVLGGDRFAADVRADEQAAADLGIRGVPTFIVDRAVGVTGAQPPELLLEMLRRGRAQRQPVPIIADGASCGPDGC